MRVRPGVAEQHEVPSVMLEGPSEIGAVEAYARGLEHRAGTGYHAEHAFLFTAADGTRRYGRYHWIPEAGEAFLTAEDGSKRGANFLRDELQARLRTGPVAFRLELQLAADGDPTDDPTTLWPADRPRVEL